MGTIDRRISAVICIILLLVAPVNAFSGTIEYDANGNIIKKPGYRFEYNDFNLLNKVYDENNLIAEYVYDDSGNRIKAVDHVNGVTTYSIGREFIRTIDSTGTHDTVYYYHGDVLVGKKNEDGLFFYHPDALGSTDIVTDERGQLIEDIEYYPFGETPNAGRSRHQFTGQVKDTTGLLYYNARYYDPELRQFTQPDTVLQNIYDPQLLNRYAYARNNPLKYTDPSGHCIWDLCFVEGTALVTALTYAVAAFAAATIAVFVYDYFYEPPEVTINDVPYQNGLPLETPGSTYDTLGFEYNDLPEKGFPISEPKSEHGQPFKFPGTEAPPIFTNPKQENFPQRSEKVDKSDSPVWQNIRKDSEPVKGHPEWRRIGDEIFRWDKTHGDVEVKQIRGRYTYEKYSIDSKTGEPYRYPKYPRREEWK